MLAVFETHPIQYHAPVWGAAAALGVPLHVCYGGDFSLRGYHDREFGTSLAWEKDLLAGYESTVLCANLDTPPEDYESVNKHGVDEWLDEFKPSAVLACGYTHPFDRAVLNGAGRRGIPLIYRGEANDSARERGVLKSLMRSVLLKRRYSQIERFLYIGEEAKRHYIRHGANSEQLDFSPYCVDTSPFHLGSHARRNLRSATRRKYEIPVESPVIMYSGKLSHRKGVDLLVRAAHRMGRDDLVILIVGDGALKHDLERIAGPARVIFVGFQNQSALSSFYHASDLLALPSRHSETWGLVVNEAMHHGLPVVVSEAVGSKLDLVVPGCTGEIAKRNDLIALESALRSCLEYAGNEKTEQSVRQKIEGYSIEAAASGLVAAWTTLQKS